MDVSAKFKVPTVRLRTLYYSLEEIYKVYDGKEFSKEEFRKTLKINPKSSGLLQKITDFKLFELLQETNDKIRITEDGKKLLTAKESDKVLELQNTVKKVELWKILFENYNTKIDPTNFWNILSRIAQLDEETAKEKSEKVLKAYLDDVNFALTQSAPKTRKAVSHPKKSKIKQITLLPQFYGTKSNVVKHNIPDNSYTLFSDYGNFQIEINDELTYNIAKISFDEIFKAIKIELIKNGIKFTNGLKETSPAV
jgi:hypothetical protein